MGKIAIIGNKFSGQHLGLQFAHQARSMIWGRKCETFFPSSLFELRRVCASLSSEEYEALVVIGGDGTLNQVIRNLGIQASRIPIYPFPGGTANDLANEMGLRPDWNQVQTLIDLKKYVWIDQLEVNQQRFVTGGGIGVGSIFTDTFNRWRSGSPVFRSIAKRLHSQIYGILAAETILLKNDYIHEVRIRGSGFDEKIRTAAVFICNQDVIGGDVRVAPPLDNADERFNVMIVTGCGRLSLLRALAEAKSGRIPSHSLVFSTDFLSISDLKGRKMSAFGDGEILVSDTELDFKLIPKSLCVYREQNQVENKVLECA